MEVIKWADYSAYTGLDRGIFKILNDPNKPKESATDVPSTSSQVGMGLFGASFKVVLAQRLFITAFLVKMRVCEVIK